MVYLQVLKIKYRCLYKQLLSMWYSAELFASRGRTIAVPPLVCRFLAEAALRSADTPLRDNGRTRHTPTARKRVSEGSSGMYSPDTVCFLAPTESSL